MDHPSSRLRNELSSGLPALGFVGDGAFEAELSAADATSTAIGRETNIYVGMPSRDAQRNALVQLILGHPPRRRKHRPFKFIPIAGFFIEQ